MASTDHVPSVPWDTTVPPPMLLHKRVSGNVSSIRGHCLSCGKELWRTSMPRKNRGAAARTLELLKLVGAIHMLHCRGCPN